MNSVNGLPHLEGGAVSAVGESRKRGRPEGYEDGEAQDVAGS